MGTKQEKDANWGGSRQGAGRKKKVAKYVGFGAPDDVAGILERVENRTAFIIEAIRHYARTTDMENPGQ